MTREPWPCQYLLAQQALVELAVRVARELVDEIDAARALVRRELRAAVGEQQGFEVRGRGGGVDGLNHGLDGFAHLGVGHADHRDVADGWMAREDVLRLLRVDVHPARDDHVGLAVREVQVAVGVEVADVAERPPAVLVRDRCGLLGIVVILERASAREVDDPGLPDR